MFLMIAFWNAFSVVGRLAIIVILTVVTSWSLVSCAPEHRGAKEFVFDPSSVPGWKQVEAKIFNPKCYSCHSGKEKPNLYGHENVLANKDDIYRAVIIKKNMPKKAPLSGDLQILLNQWLTAGAPLEGSQAFVDESIDFTNLKRPLQWSFLKEKVLDSVCLTCHGSENRKPDSPAILDNPEAFRRHIEDIIFVSIILPEAEPNHEKVMPPPDESKVKLSKAQKELIVLWLLDGMPPTLKGANEDHQEFVAEEDSLDELSDESSDEGAENSMHADGTDLGHHETAGLTGKRSDVLKKYVVSLKPSDQIVNLKFTALHKIGKWKNQFKALNRYTKGVSDVALDYITSQYNRYLPVAPILARAEGVDGEFLLSAKNKLKSGYLRIPIGQIYTDNSIQTCILRQALRQQKYSRENVGDEGKCAERRASGATQVVMAGTVTEDKGSEALEQTELKLDSLLFEIKQISFPKRTGEEAISHEWEPTILRGSLSLGGKTREVQLEGSVRAHANFKHLVEFRGKFSVMLSRYGIKLDIPNYHEIQTVPKNKILQNLSPGIMLSKLKSLSLYSDVGTHLHIGLNLTLQNQTSDRGLANTTEALSDEKRESPHDSRQAGLEVYSVGNVFGVTPIQFEVRYRLNPKKSWKKASRHYGSVPFVSGELKLNSNDFTKSQGKFRVDIFQMKSGKVAKPLRECHMQQALSFDYKKSIYPKKDTCTTGNMNIEDRGEEAPFSGIEFEVLSIITDAKLANGQKAIAKLFQTEQPVTIVGRWKIHGIQRTHKIKGFVKSQAGKGGALEFRALPFNLSLKKFNIVIRQNKFLNIYDKVKVKLNLLFTPVN